MEEAANHTERERRAGRAVGVAEVHVWAVDLAASSTPGVAPTHRETALGVRSDGLVVLPPIEPTTRERERAGRFRSSADAAIHLAAHGALRLILARYLRCRPSDIPVATAEHGKPYIVGDDLSFNLSHSGTVALIAVARGRQVGVDIERHRPIAEVEAILSRIATPREQAAWRNIAEQERERAFFELWTRKESLAKMTGEGIRAIGRETESADDVDYRLQAVLDLPGYSACVAARGREWTLVRCT